MSKKVVRKFDSGAIRDVDDNKLDYEGFISPAVMEVFAQYMHTHRKIADGSLRDSDNWQKGIPISAYRKSLVRHLFQLWGVWRGQDVYDDKGSRVGEVEALCAVLFNTQGYLHELTKKKNSRQEIWAALD